MSLSQVAASARKYRWWWALLAVVVAGYVIGKDMAMRDNQADRPAAEAR